MRRLPIIALLPTISLALGCGSGININHDWDREASFSAYKSYAWLANAPAPASDAVMAEERNDLLDRRIKSAVNAELSGKGLYLTEKDSDLLVAYHTGIQDKVNVTDWGYRYGDYYWGWGGRDISVYNYREGTLILDLIDAKTKELVFRASATKTLAENPTPEQVEKTINKVVKKMLSNYPPKR